MQPVLDETTRLIPASAQEQDQVREQMSRLLETNYFKNSRRYPALFRFVVEETLQGRGEFLKERLLGIRVFDRAPDYDTATDPIVRVTIAEIRKRIAQYYHDEAHHLEMRIELLPGHYAPEFHFRKEVASEQHGVVASLNTDQPLSARSNIPDNLAITSAELQAKPAVTSSRIWLGLRSWPAISAVALILVSAASLLLWRTTHPSALDQFWAPVLASHKPVLLCIPTGAGKTGEMAAFTSGDLHARPGEYRLSPVALLFLDHESLEENVVYSDVLAMVKVAGLLATRGAGVQAAPQYLHIACRPARGGRRC